MTLRVGAPLTSLTILALLISPVGANDNGKNSDDTAFLKNPRQLTYDGRRSGEGYFSPDGRHLIFQSEREPGNPFFQIYVLDLQTGDSHRVSPGVGKTTCAFFRPGTDQVLFASSHLDPEAKAKQEEEIEFRASGKQHRYSWDYDPYMDIFVARRNGSNLQRLTEAFGYDAEGSYSPDGSQIVFCSLRDAYTGEDLSPEDKKRLEVDPAYFGEIYIMNADGSDQRRLTSWPGYDGGPFFMPDGERILWRHFEEDGMVADAYTMRLDGSDVQRLTDFGAMSWAPYAHPSGAYVIFASNKLGFSNFELYIVDAAGKREPVRVTYADGFDGLPVFSPDGKNLCWTSNRTSSGGSQLFLAEWQHQAALQALEAAPPRQPSDAETSDGRNGSELHGEVDHHGDHFSHEITPEDLTAQVGFLASDSLEGRMTGRPGIRKAAEYLADYLRDYGLQPLGDDGTYFQEFEFTSGVEVVPEGNELIVTQTNGAQKPLRFDVNEDFRPLAFTENATVEGEVVFAGYGLSVPGRIGQGYDSYADLDVKDKIVLVLRYVPEGVSMERRQALNVYAGLRYKALVAREHGAKALLVVSGPNSPNAGELIPLSFDASAATSGIVAASVSGRLADALFAMAGKDLQAVQSELDVENPHFEGRFTIPNVRLKISTAVRHIRQKDRNVVALLPPAATNRVDEYVVIGAHYDHIGYGEIGSLAKKGEEGEIHNGADDNASGTAAVMELTAALAEARRQNPAAFKRGVIVGFWSGEELGLIGSSHFVDHPPVPLEHMIAYLNFDMVGRLRDKQLILQGVGSSQAWRKLIEKRNVAAGFDLALQNDPYLPTDATAFYPKGVPVLSFFTGSHDDYNRPTDDPENLNYEGLDRIAEFARLIILDLLKSDERPDYVKVERSGPPGGAREALRAYLGTIPDYATEGVEGVKLSGVRAGGPANKAGLRGGDVIVEFAGQKITNIYDYTYALDAVKIGEPVQVVVLRDGKRVTLTVVPEARE